ncbi:MAG: potassium channel family protein [Solirubrobacteraceae bacterium]|jgi:uncharacterized membrane protein|nr:potassium channel family protein [Solirubrobacteraceae bacterium]
MESFSDGVIAVAITLLVLGITVPDPHANPHHYSLIYELGQRWPSYAAYVTSFLTIGIVWINHHAMIDRLQQSDQVILMLNLLLLMSIGILPFATNLMATYLRESSGQSLAAAVYAGSFLLMSLAFAALNRTILLHRAQLLGVRLELDARRAVLRRAVIGLVPYAVAIPLAFLSPYITLIICAVVAAYYAHPVSRGGQRSA